VGVTLWRFTLITRPDLFAEAEAQYAIEAFGLARPELCEKASKAQGGKAVAVSFSDCRVTQPREAVSIRLTGAQRGAL